MVLSKKTINCLPRFLVSVILLLWQLPMVHAQDFFVLSEAFFQRYVHPPDVDYRAIRQSPEELKNLLLIAEKFPVDEVDENTRKAFWINTYNLLVIQEIVIAGAIESPLDVPGFFSKGKISVAGELLSLDDIERKKLLRPFADPRLHFVLVCGAKSCPPLQPAAFIPRQVEQQITDLTRSFINDPDFVKITENTVEVSELFRWYPHDFGPLKPFLKQYLQQPVDEHFRIRYRTYDWSLNESRTSTVLIRPYRASLLLPRGAVEIKIFNSLYTQVNFDGFDTGNSRNTYFSSYAQFLFGSHRNRNIGFDLVYKSNLLGDFAEHTSFAALRFQNFSKHQIFSCLHPGYHIAETSACYQSNISEDSLRQANGDAIRTEGQTGLSHFGPKIKFNPWRKRKNLSLQQTLYFPVQKAVDGQWISSTQLFYDRPVGSRFQVFAEVGLWTTVAPGFRLFPAVKVFYSYFPTQRLTLYSMASVPAEYGAGVKYRFWRNFEVEVLYTHYLPLDFLVGDVRPRTFNMGIRYLRR